eukprot:ANDGO_04279.mRNA.1 hypothetical protein GUITHDRAFT_107373
MISRFRNSWSWSRAVFLRNLWVLSLLSAAFLIVLTATSASSSSASPSSSSSPLFSSSSVAVIQEEISRLELSNASLAVDQMDVSAEHCRSSTESAGQLVDDSGRVCSVSPHSLRTGCCPDTGSTAEHVGQLALHCTSAKNNRVCDVASKCCVDHAMCVACCLRPEYRDTNADMLFRLKTEGGKRAKYYEHADDGWEYCVRRCRTDSSSTVHETSFKSAFPFCFFAALGQ